MRAGAGRRGGAFLLECSALGSRPPCGSNRGVLRSVHACRAVLLECSALDHACRAVLLECLAFGSRLSLFLCQEKRDGLRDVAFLFRRGSESPLVRSHDFARLSDFAGSLRVCPFLYGDSDGNPEEVQEAIGKPPGERTSLEQKLYPCAVTRNAGCRAPQSSCKPIVFLWRSDCAFAATPRGVRWGSAPQTAPKSLRLSGLSSFGPRRGCAWRGEGAREQQRLIFCSHVPQHSGTRRDLPESDLCSGKSGCTAMIPTSSNVQTRAAPKRRRVGLTRAKRSGRRHCRLSLRSPPCGW